MTAIHFIAVIITNLSVTLSLFRGVHTIMMFHMDCRFRLLLFGKSSIHSFHLRMSPEVKMLIKLSHWFQRRLHPMTWHEQNTPCILFDNYYLISDMRCRNVSPIIIGFSLGELSRVRQSKRSYRNRNYEQLQKAD